MPSIVRRRNHPSVQNLRRLTVSLVRLRFLVLPQGGVAFFPNLRVNLVRDGNVERRVRLLFGFVDRPLLSPVLRRERQRLRQLPTTSGSEEIVDDLDNEIESFNPSGSTARQPIERATLRVVLERHNVVPGLPPPRPIQRGGNRRRHAIIPHKVTFKKAIRITVGGLEALARNPFHLGGLTNSCAHCGALFFSTEPKNRQGVHMDCCKNGMYEVERLRACPGVLKDLYISNHPEAVEFRREIRTINSLFAMASFKTSKPSPIREGQGHWSYAVCGQIYHFLGGVPTEQDLARPTLNHYYFLDAPAAIRNRSTFLGDRVSVPLLEKIENCLRRVNIYAQAYRSMGEVLEEETRRRNGVRPVQNVIIAFSAKRAMNRDLATYNLPQSRSEVAAIFMGEEPPFQVDLKLYPRYLPENMIDDDVNPDVGQEERNHELKNLSPLADPMVYPLLFPYGENGYSQELRHTLNRQKTLTSSQFYRYRIQIRDTPFSTLHSGCTLFQQYLVDAWCKVEGNRLWYLKQHQRNFRFSAQSVLARMQARRRQAGDGPILTNLQANVGKIFILPATFPGGDRYIQRKYLDSMTVVGRHGRPDLFITMTCNPNWPEIKNNLGDKQKWENRPDLLCRVFHTKLMEFLDDVVKKQIYGIVRNYHYVIEFQKRGLPHAHIIVTFIEQDSLRDVPSIDSIISASIPDANLHPELCRLVGEYQLHPPCGIMNETAACMQDGKCSKYFPKAYRDDTSLQGVGFAKRPDYRRPNDGRTIFWAKYNRHFTNRRVVPYNSYALCKYQCHMNFEAMGSLYSMKYLFKYVNKGSDAITVLLMDEALQQNPQQLEAVQQDAQTRTVVHDEIQQYLDFRYVSAMEATWRLLEYPTFGRSHAVIVLPVHLLNERIIIYEEDDAIDELENRLLKPSKLESYFTLNSHDIAARNYYYSEIPEYYTWNASDAVWTARRHDSKVLGCMCFVAPTDAQIEKYYLRVLLTYVRGATSYENLRTVDGNVCDTFRDACRARGLFRFSDEYERCMRDAAVEMHPTKMRRLFGLLCCIAVDENFEEIPLLWTRFKHLMVADYIHRGGMDLVSAVDRCYDDIMTIVRRNRPDLTADRLGIVKESEIDDPGVIMGSPIPVAFDNAEIANVDNVLYVADNAERYQIGNLKVDQKSLFLRILQNWSTRNNVQVPFASYQQLADVYTDADFRDVRLHFHNDYHIYYVDGPGGTGKTHLYNTLIHFFNNTLLQPTIAVAWTGIAANLLIGGTTAHRAFKLPFLLHDTSVAGWPIETPFSQRVKKAALIIWDEAPMTPKLAVMAVDRFLKDLCGNTLPMGGKLCVFGGDFRQVLPVIPGGHRNEIISNTLIRLYFWSSMTQLKLSYNLRTREFPAVLEELSDTTFADWLLSLGGGLIPFAKLSATAAPVAPIDLIEIPRIFRVDTILELIRFVYAGDFVCKDNGNKAILCPTNVSVTSINDAVYDQIQPGGEKIYTSIDTYDDGPEDELQISEDILHSIDCASLPPHILRLKPGCIVMLLRNLDLDEGLCNGSRLIVISLADHSVHCEILTGSHKGIRIHLPRMKLVARDTMLPHEISRFQFPIKLAYAMTINKSQGQSFARVGICLVKPCFTHGQLYVAFSRVSSADHVKIYVENTDYQGAFKYRDGRFFTRNVVFFGVLGIERIVMEMDPFDIPIPDNVYDGDNDGCFDNLPHPSFQFPPSYHRIIQLQRFSSSSSSSLHTLSPPPATSSQSSYYTTLPPLPKSSSFASTRSIGTAALSYESVTTTPKSLTPLTPPSIVSSTSIHSIRHIFTPPSTLITRSRSSRRFISHESDESDAPLSQNAINNIENQRQLEDHFWRGGVPLRDECELKRRKAKGTLAGTS